MTNREKRSQFIEQWYKTEKTLFRLAGIVLLFSTGLIAAFDQPGDTLTATAIAGCLSGGITLLSLNRRPRQQRTKLTFLQEKQQTTRAMFAGGIAMILFIQQGIRPLVIIVGALFIIVAIWYQWRAHKIRQFTQLFDTPSTPSQEESVE